MNTQNHIILKEVLELTVPNRDRAIAVQNRASEIVKQKLHPGLDRVFSRITGNGDILRIERLEIDLGTISEEDLEKVLVEKTVKEAGKKISALLATGKGPSRHISAVSAADKKEDKLKVVSAERDILEQFVFFLRTGRFPWWHKRSEGNSLDDVFSKILKTNSSSLKTALLPVFRETTVRKRLILQFNDHQIENLLKRIDEKLFSGYHKVVLELLRSAGSVKYKKLLKESFHEVLFRYYSGVKKPLSKEQKTEFVTDILSTTLTAVPEREKQAMLSSIIRVSVLTPNRQTRMAPGYIIAATVQVMRQLTAVNDELFNVVKAIPAESNDYPRQLIDSFILEHGKTALKAMPGKKQVKSRPVETPSRKAEKGPGLAKDVEYGYFKPKDAKDETVLKPALKPVGDGDEIYICNAGLVLLHPLLRYFFEGLGLLDKELMFKGRDEAFKAVHLLQFTATGSESTPEYDLTFNKVMCGLEVTQPVPKDLLLSVNEKEECIHLIKTVLDRWAVLKTKNPEALRQTYLQREGIMKQAGQGWNITVERNTFDVMLEKLPWAVSIIRFPWSPQILYVEW